MQKLSETRKYQYDYHNENYPYFNDWRRNPYTFLKAKFDMEAAALLVYFLLKTKIKPNTVTMFYGLAGIVGGILLAIPSNVTHIIAVFIFFTKSILDLSDGHLARVTNQTSITGHILDVHGAVLNYLGLQIGLGFYVAFKTANPVFYYLVPLIPFFYAVKLKPFTRAMLFEEISKKGFINNGIKTADGRPASDEIYAKAKAGILGKYNRYSRYFSNFLDARARSVDFICLLILIEVFTSLSITWIIFIIFVTKGLLQFIGSYYITINKGWVEKTLGSVR